METDPPAETLSHRAHRVLSAQLVDALPGFEEYLATDSTAADWIAEQEAKINAAIRDDDSILLDRALGSWTKAIARVNEHLAEKYRQAHPDAEFWELRYLKWMIKVKYIRFECPMGEFYVVPRMPTRRPKAPHWYTVDELLDMLHPTTIAAIKAFNALPVRPDALPAPGPDEKHLHVDVSDAGVVLTYDFQGGPRRGRKQLR